MPPHFASRAAALDPASAGNGQRSPCPLDGMTNGWGLEVGECWRWQRWGLGEVEALGLVTAAAFRLQLAGDGLIGEICYTYGTYLNSDIITLGSGLFSSFVLPLLR